MKKLLIASAALLFAASVFSPKVSAQNIETLRQTPYIEVTGKAEKEIAPDQIYLSIAINEKDYKNRTLTDVEKNMLKELEKLKIDTKKDLAVKDLGSNFKKYFIKGNDAKLSKEYQLIVHDARTAGQVIIAMEKVGISQISIDRVDNSRLKEYRNELKAEAMKDAKAKAELLTGAIGQTIGSAIYINDQESYYRPYSMDRMMVSKAAGAENSIEEVPEIAFENIQISATVQVWWELHRSPAE